MEITLDELLLFRERRAVKQREMLDKRKAPLVSFTMNIPGPEKTSPLVERAFDLGACLIRETLGEVDIAEEYEKHSKCGPVLILSVNADAEKLKKSFTKIEDDHPIGRLFDIDVIDPSGAHLSRGSERGCIVCGAPGRACARSRRHPVEELVAITNKIMRDFFLDADVKRIVAMARDSLLSEVYTTPKPGLVDTENSGSHSDMSVRDFERSAESLLPYFEDCLMAGFASKNNPELTPFQALRELGLNAEKRMYEATLGKNTHKGAIFSFGIILGAVGRLMTLDATLPNPSDILSEAKRISRPHLEKDISEFVGKTAGERAYIERGVRGIRGEAMDGFPTLSDIAIPVYKSAIASGKNENDAGVITLLHLIANVYDTCLYKRGGDDGVVYASSYAKTLISSNEISLDTVRKMNADFVERNLSPGGCADLLALTYFLTSLEDENTK